MQIRYPLKSRAGDWEQGQPTKGETQPMQSTYRAAHGTEPGRRWSCVSDPGVSATLFQASGYTGRQTLILRVYPAFLPL